MHTKECIGILIILSHLTIRKESRAYLEVHILVFLLHRVHFDGQYRELGLLLQTALFGRLAILEKPRQAEKMR